MLVMVIGLVLFFAIHFVPSNAAMRDGLIARFGLTGYKAIFGIVSLIGFALIVLGFPKLQHAPGQEPAALGCRRCGRGTWQLASCGRR